jgi:hypothetical protein
MDLREELGSEGVTATDLFVAQTGPARENREGLLQNLMMPFGRFVVY